MVYIYIYYIHVLLYCVGTCRHTYVQATHVFHPQSAHEQYMCYNTTTLLTILVCSFSTGFLQLHLFTQHCYNYLSITPHSC